jgi:hypothetical protein
VVIPNREIRREKGDHVTRVLDEERSARRSGVMEVLAALPFEASAT